MEASKALGVHRSHQADINATRIVWPRQKDWGHCWARRQGSHVDGRELCERYEEWVVRVEVAGNMESKRAVMTTELRLMSIHFLLFSGAFEQKGTENVQNLLDADTIQRASWNCPSSQSLRHSETAKDCMDESMLALG